MARPQSPAAAAAMARRLAAGMHQAAASIPARSAHALAKSPAARLRRPLTNRSNASASPAACIRTVASAGSSPCRTASISARRSMLPACAFAGGVKPNGSFMLAVSNGLIPTSRTRNNAEEVTRLALAAPRDAPDSALTSWRWPLENPVGDTVDLAGCDQPQLVLCIGVDGPPALRNGLVERRLAALDLLVGQDHEVAVFHRADHVLRFHGEYSAQRLSVARLGLSVKAVQFAGVEVNGGRVEIIRHPVEGEPRRRSAATG